VAGLRRRRLLTTCGAWCAAHPALTGLITAVPLLGAKRTALACQARRRPAESLAPPRAMVQLHVGAGGNAPPTLYGVSSDGTLWRWAGARWTSVGEGLDPSAPLASGFDRVVGRAHEGGLWVARSGRVERMRLPTLAAHGGFALRADGVVAIASTPDGTHHALRLAPDDVGAWREQARSAEPLLPDAQPVPFEAGRGSTASLIALLGAPDAERYRHGVLGDAIEARALLLLDAGSLQLRARLELPAPYVFEDIAPRPIAWRGARALLSVRSGPLGAQLAVLQLRGPGELVIAALGEPIGTKHRWMAPITDGEMLLAVHTPHLGGVLHRYRDDGAKLQSEALHQGVSNHAIGTREMRLAAWVNGSLVVPTQDCRSLRCLRLPAHGTATIHADAALEAPVEALFAWQRDGTPGVVALLRDGDVAWLAL
jgi:hypothetical protein